MEQVNFNGRNYSVQSVLPVADIVRDDLGVVQQSVISGKRGACGLLQKFNDGTARVIWHSGHRVEYDFSGVQQ